MTKEEFIQQLVVELQNGTADLQTDNYGQVIIYTGVFKQADGGLSEGPDPNFEE